MNPFIPWDDFKGFTGCAYNIPAGKEKAPQIIDLQSFYKTFVPLTDEILNLWNDFLEIVDYLQSTPQISKIIESI